MTVPEGSEFFRQMVRNLGRRVHARMRGAGTYSHPSGVGDERELALVEALRELLPSRFGVDRGKVFDSRGKVSREVDILIYERDECITALAVGGRIVLPVETVCAAIEVKSYLNQNAYRDAVNNLGSLDSLRRFYEYTDSLNPLNDATVERVNEGFTPFESALSVLPVWTGIVALDGVKSKTLAGYLSEQAPPGLLFACITGREVVVPQVEPQGFRGIGLGDDALGFMLWILASTLAWSNRRRHFKPDLDRYRAAFVESLAPFGDGWTLRLGESGKPSREDQ